MSGSAHLGTGVVVNAFPFRLEHFLEVRDRIDARRDDQNLGRCAVATVAELLEESDTFSSSRPRWSAAPRVLEMWIQRRPSGASFAPLFSQSESVDARDVVSVVSVLLPIQEMKTFCRRLARLFLDGFKGGLVLARSRRANEKDRFGARRKELGHLILKSGRHQEGRHIHPRARPAQGHTQVLARITKPISNLGIDRGPTPLATAADSVGLCAESRGVSCSSDPSIDGVGAGVPGSSRVLYGAHVTRKRTSLAPFESVFEEPATAGAKRRAGNLREIREQWLTLLPCSPWRRPILSQPSTGLDVAMPATAVRS